MEILFQSNLDRPLVSLILLDWSCRESFHMFQYLSNQTISREQYEIIWIEYYSRRSPEIAAGLEECKKLGKPPIVDKWIVLGMPNEVYYHKHFMYNLGITLSNGRIVTICDSDAIVSPTFIESIIKAFAADPNIVLHLDEVRNTSKKYYPFNYPTIKEVISEGCINFKNGKTIGILDTEDPIHTRNYGACMSALREDLINIGGADEHIDYLGHVCGPYELTFRLVNAGKKEKWHEEEFFYHVWHPGTDGRDNYLGPHDGRNMSSTALEILKTRRVAPLLENPAIEMLRTTKGDKISKASLLSRVVDEDRIVNWGIDEFKRLCSLGRIAYCSGEYEEAIKHWKTALEIKPLNTDLLTDIGWAYYLKASYLEAMNAFNEAIRLGVNNYSAFNGRAWTNCQIGNFDQSINDFQEVLQHSNQLENKLLQDIFRGLGWAFFHKDYLDDALKNFLKALDSIDKYDKGVLQDLYRGIGWTYIRKNEFPKAEYHFNKAIDNIDPSNESILKDAMNGLSAAHNAFKNSPPDLHVQSVKGNLQKYFPETDTIWDNSAEVPFNKERIAKNIRCSLLNEMGWKYYLKRNYDMALSTFNKALRFNPHNYRALCGRGWVFLQKYEFDVAIDDFSMAMRNRNLLSRNDLQEILRGRGWAYYHIGSFCEAIDDFDEALENTKEDDYNVLKHIYVGRSNTYYRLGEIDKAIENLEKCGVHLSKNKYLLILRFAFQVYGAAILQELTGKELGLVRLFQNLRAMVLNLIINITKIEKLRKIHIQVDYKKEDSDASDYPINIPNIGVKPDLEFLLLELPPRYMPMMPNGLGYVHNILMKCEIRFQTIDLNLIIYHKYHKERLKRKPETMFTPSGYKMVEDPWDSANMGEWDIPEVIEYFLPYLEETINGIALFQPKAVGISLNGNNRSLVKKFTRSLRKKIPNLVIVVGGYDCFYYGVGQELFSDFDYMLIGEAELTLEPLVKALAKGERPRKLPGIISRYDSSGRIWKEPPLLWDLDSIDFPKYQWAEIPWYQTYERKHFIPITASRGCNWGRCHFCGEKFPFRQRNPVKVVDEIEYYTKYGMHTFHFNESDVNGNPQALYDLCSEIIRRNIKVKLVGQLRVDKRNTAEYFKHLAKAGFTHLRFGVDGWTDRLIKLQNKGYNMSIVFQNLRDCYTSGITTTVNIVIGVPGETEKDVDETIENIIQCKDFISEVISFNTLILTCGSDYYREPEKYKIRFRNNREEIYKEYPHFIPTDLWYSENPYIDQKIRLRRLDRIATELYKTSSNIGSFAAKVIENLRGGAKKAPKELCQVIR